MHPVAIDKFWACEILVGKLRRIYPKISFYRCGFGSLVFASISAFLKFCSDFTSPHMPCSPLFDIQRLLLASLRSHDQAFWKVKFFDYLALLGAHLPVVAFVVEAQHVQQTVRKKQRRLVIPAVP